VRSIAQHAAQQSERGDALIQGRRASLQQVQPKSSQGSSGRRRRKRGALGTLLPGARDGLCPALSSHPPPPTRPSSPRSLPPASSSTSTSPARTPSSTTSRSTLSSWGWAPAWPRPSPPAGGTSISCARCRTGRARPRSRSQRRWRCPTARGWSRTDTWAARSSCPTSACVRCGGMCASVRGGGCMDVCNFAGAGAAQAPVRRLLMRGRPATLHSYQHCAGVGAAQAERDASCLPRKERPAGGRQHRAGDDDVADCGHGAARGGSQGEARRRGGFDTRAARGLRWRWPRVSAASGAAGALHTRTLPLYARTHLPALASTLPTSLPASPTYNDRPLRPTHTLSPPYPQVYLASASPPVRFPNVYGVDMPSRAEFVAHELSEQQICEVILICGVGVGHLGTWAWARNWNLGLRVGGHA
jgi:hypothetical protein